MQTTNEFKQRFESLDVKVWLQGVFGATLILLGMFLITPDVMGTKNVTLLFIAVALLCFKDGLVQLVSSFLAVTEKKD